VRASVEQPDHSYVIEERGEPVCGEDFCDQCGDCLHCEADSECPHGQHTWVIYLDAAVRGDAGGE